MSVSQAVSIAVLMEQSGQFEIVVVPGNVVLARATTSFQVISRCRLGLPMAMCRG
jgi:hypothetical protein